MIPICEALCLSENNEYMAVPGGDALQDQEGQEYPQNENFIIQNMISKSTSEFGPAASIGEPFLDERTSISLQYPTSFFEGANPIINLDGLRDSWGRIQEWAEDLLQPELNDESFLQDVEAETSSAEEIRFCCYGMIPNVSIKLLG
ncbi:hypothetical protein F5Y10DRAFT_240523, partial [Nemania abortiva]